MSMLGGGRSIPPAGFTPSGPAITGWVSRWRLPAWPTGV
jgi:hypothetical protein